MILAMCRGFSVWSFGMTGFLVFLRVSFLGCLKSKGGFFKEVFRFYRVFFFRGF